MDASAIDLPDPNIALNCVISGAQPALASALRSRLERSARVGAVERLNDALTLERALTLGRTDLVVHVLAGSQETLPPCLLAHADVRVLVVSPQPVEGPLSHWLQQGANDMAACDDEDGLSHALSRLLDECSLLATLRRQRTIIDTQRRRIEALTENSAPAAASGCALSGTVARTAVSTPARTASPAPPVADACPEPRSVIDTRDGLPGRRQTLQHLDALTGWATAAHEHAVAVSLGFPHEESTAGKLERTLCDLTVYRAVSAIRRAIPQALLLGRTHPATLLLVLPAGAARGACGARDERSERDALITLRRALGTLGELLERPEELSIQTLSGPLSSLTSDELEARFERERNATAADELTALLQPLPMLSARRAPAGPALAVARS